VLPLIYCSWTTRLNRSQPSQRLPIIADSGIVSDVSTLTEIEQAAVKLTAEEQKRLLRFLLRILPLNEVELPEPRIFSKEEIESWLAEDAAGMRRFREET
jgi:hypothetical protein